MCQIFGFGPYITSSQIVFTRFKQKMEDTFFQK